MSPFTYEATAMNLLSPNNTTLPIAKRSSIKYNPYLLEDRSREVYDFIWRVGNVCTLNKPELLNINKLLSISPIKSIGVEDSTRPINFIFCGSLYGTDPLINFLLG